VQGAGIVGDDPEFRLRSPFSNCPHGLLLATDALILISGL